MPETTPVRMPPLNRPRLLRTRALGTAARLGAEQSAEATDIELVHRLIDERLVLEVGLAHLAAENRTDAHIAAIDETIAMMDAAATWTDYHRADALFHREVAAAAELPAVLPLYTRTLDSLYTYFLPYPMTFLHENNDDHRGIRTAIVDRDGTAAVHQVRAHIAALHHSMTVTRRPVHPLREG